MEVPVYYCEVCNLGSQNHHEVLACERKHAEEVIKATCVHEFGYAIGAYEDCYGGGCDIQIEKKCKLCGVVNDRLVSNHSFSQEVLEAVYNK